MRMRTLLPLALACLPVLAAATPIAHGDAGQLKHDIAGQYRLDSGRDVVLSRIGDRLYIDLNRNYRRELRPVAPNLLASRDGALTVEYVTEGGAERILIRHAHFPAGARLGEHRWYGGR